MSVERFIITDNNLTFDVEESTRPCQNTMLMCPDLEFDRVTSSGFFLCTQAQTSSNFSRANGFTAVFPVMGLLADNVPWMPWGGDKFSSAQSWPAPAHESQLLTCQKLCTCRWIVIIKN